MEIEKARVNLEADRTRLLGEKNSLVAKREEFQAEIVTLNITGSSNVLVYNHQDPFLGLIQDKFKVKRSSSFDGLKKNLQRFFIRIRYYQRFYQQSLLFDSDKV